MTTTIAAHPVLTASPRQVLRRSLFWFGAAGVILIVGVISVGLTGTTKAGPPLSASNPAPAGAMAVAAVLRQQGVTVIETSTLAATKNAITDRANTTLFIYDNQLILDPDQLRKAAGLASRVVLADPGFAGLGAIAPELTAAGAVTGTLTAGCALPAATKAGAIGGGPVGYRITGDPSGVVGCFGSGDRVFSLVELGGGRLSVLGATAALSNDHVAEAGNAALALNLLGQSSTLVWYLPTIADLPLTSGQSLNELMPTWVVRVMSLLAIVFVAAAVWRGRRFGPLVIENLPVTVRSSETMLGRARLYEKHSARLRALDALRIGAIDRLAVACGLGRAATVDEVATSVAELIGAPPGSIRGLLVDEIPANDGDLVRLSDALLKLEREVGIALRP